MSWLDRAIAWVSPSWGASRERSKLVARHYEAAAFGRRTSGWSRLGTDANAAAGGAALALMRAQARDLVRNNPWARRGLNRMVSNAIGWGIRPKPTGRGAATILSRWETWAETTQCDAGGQLTMYGIQALVFRALIESGEVLIRRRMRRLSDGLSVPMQLQVLEADLLDTGKDSLAGSEGGEIIQGVEFNGIGQRVAYWLFDKHPGALGSMPTSPISRRIPAEGVIHVYRIERPGQVRGPSWFASVDARLHDFDEFEDATLMKQKIAACMAAFVTDIDGHASPLGQGGTDQASGQPVDTFEPGMIIPLQPGKSVLFTNPPVATDHRSFSAASLRGVGAGLGVTYEDLTGDYSQVNYSSGRMGRLGHQRDIHDWLWNTLIPQFCAPAWAWMLNAMILAGDKVDDAPAEWSPAPLPLLEPDVEIGATNKAIRNGLVTWPQAIREQGLDPKVQLAEIVEYNQAFDRDEVVLDCDPRMTNSSGQQQQSAEPEPAAAASSSSDAGDAGDAAGGEPTGTTH